MKTIVEQNGPIFYRRYITITKYWLFFLVCIFFPISICVVIIWTNEFLPSGNLANHISSWFITVKKGNYVFFVDYFGSHFPWFFKILGLLIVVWLFKKICRHAIMYESMKKEYMVFENSYFPDVSTAKIKEIFFKLEIRKIKWRWYFKGVVGSCGAVCFWCIVIACIRYTIVQLSGTGVQIPVGNEIIKGLINGFADTKFWQHTLYLGNKESNLETNLLCLSVTLFVFFTIKYFVSHVITSTTLKQIHEIYGEGEVVDSVELQTRSEREEKKGKFMCLVLLFVFGVIAYLVAKAIMGKKHK